MLLDVPFQFIAGEDAQVAPVFNLANNIRRLGSDTLMLAQASHRIGEFARQGAHSFEPDHAT
jgi:hypothetical protein